MCRGVERGPCRSSHAVVVSTAPNESTGVNCEGAGGGGQSRLIKVLRCGVDLCGLGSVGQECATHMVIVST